MRNAYLLSPSRLHVWWPLRGESEDPFDAANPPPASREENLRSKRWHFYGSGRVICPECFPAKEWQMIEGWALLRKRIMN